MSSQQVKSKQRVADHGEVFTNEREVKAMLDLVWKNLEQGTTDNVLKATFLEPACGSGNFLAEILQRKLLLVQEFDRKEKSQDKFQRNLITALTSIYGVELLQDNAQECRQRLYDLTLNFYPKKYQQDSHFPKMQKNIEYILSQNIICGNALDYTNSEGNYITFIDWKWINQKIQRNFFYFDTLTYGGLYANTKIDYPAKEVLYLDLYTSENDIPPPEAKPIVPPKTKKVQKKTSPIDAKPLEMIFPD